MDAESETAVNEVHFRETKQRRRECIWSGHGGHRPVQADGPLQPFLVPRSVRMALEHTQMYAFFKVPP